MRTSEGRRDVAIVGRSCRLPGASSVDELWTNLVEGRCTVTEVPDDRWSKLKHGHPRPKEPGKSYTWAAGVIDDIWKFDPTVFGISPREAEQMDPQQRLLLELTWEALEDAGIPRGKLAGTDVGVFVGASSPEYTVIRNTDIAGGDAYTATGGAISIISNRISHAFDFQGPSFTVDTACSSSLVALHQAMEALESGRIDTAIVGGINLLLSPFGFIIFSQASMLSPDGRCQTFDSRANGYVRAEGAVVLVLQSVERAQRDDTRMYARIAGSGVNSDGRTNGIALPSRYSQGKLLRQVYESAGITPAQVAFVEAHGTGTRVGDPIEAFTIGEVLGRDRTEPLRVGSIKSNIGHLEPASGLAGVLKAMLALEHDLLPPSVNYLEPNPEIPFGDLNLEVCAEPTPLPRLNGTRYAGVNSFGFGGTNAHVVIGDPPAPPRRKKQPISGAERFVISGATRDAVRDLAREYRRRLGSANSERIQEAAAAVAHGRELMSERAVIDWKSPRDFARKLERVAHKDDDVPGITWGSVTELNAPVAFVFSGNGSQWAGMGRLPYSTNRSFREGLDEVDALFDAEFGWSVTEALFANDLDQRLHLTHVAQPLIFSVQIATARALAAQGVTPSCVLGHSVGEIAAAAVSGALSLRDAVHLIHARSTHQELAKDAGRMGVAVGSLEQVHELASTIDGLEIAAFNSPRTFTLAGPTESIKAFGALARKRRMVFRQLDLDYPFHCALVDCVREPLLRDLRDLKPGKAAIPFVSTVTGDVLDGTALDGTYWWNNVREPVRFSAAVEGAARLGARVFTEIGPRSVLLSFLSESLEPTGHTFAALGVLEKRDDPENADPIGPAAVNAFVRGAAVDLTKLVGPEPQGHVPLPTYRWQRKTYAVNTTPEAVGFTLSTRWHRLIGARNTSDGVEWVGQLDTAALPELGDHVVGGQAILPAAAFIEIGLSCARDWFETDNAALLDLEISVPLALERDRAKEVKARLSPNTNTLEILSRPRLSRSGWQLHGTAKITAGSAEPIVATLPKGTGKVVDAATVYAAADGVGLHYGPEFRLVEKVTRVGPESILVDLVPSAPHGDYRIDPARLDACFHGLFVLFSELGARRRGTAYLPVRFGHIRLSGSGASPAKALIEIRKSGERSIISDFTLFDAGGVPIGVLSETRFQAARVQRAALLGERALVMSGVLADAGVLGGAGPTGALGQLKGAAETLGILAETDHGTADQMLLDGWASAAGFGLARALFPSGFVGTEALAGRGAAAPWLSNLLHALEGSGLATPTDDGWRLAEESGLPEPSAILRTLADESPSRSSELLLASAIGTIAGAEAAAADLEAAGPAGGTIDGFELGGASIRASSDTLERLVTHSGLLASGGRALCILQVGYGPLSHALERLARRASARMTVFEPDARRFERAKLALGNDHLLTLTDTLDGLPAGGFDLILSAERLHRAGGAAIARLHELLTPGGLLAAIEPIPSAFRDLTLGLGAGWFETELVPGFPVSPLQTAESWVGTLQSSGFEGAVALPADTGRDAALLLLAGPSAATTVPVQTERKIRITPSVFSRDDELATCLDALLAMDGHQVELAAAGRISPGGLDHPDTLMFVVDPARSDAEADLVEKTCLELKECADKAVGTKAELWVVVASADGAGDLADPVTTAILSFARTLANEYPAISVRRVSGAASVSADAMAAAVRSLMMKEQTETDFLVGPEGCQVLRVEPLPAAPPGGRQAGAARLERGVGGGLSGLAWIGTERPVPKAGEVEIDVAVTGLNFRDVMWAMSLLPDELLEDGFAGPTLGLECAGRVVRVGRDVTRFAVGDEVIAFAPSAFSTAVCVPENVVARVPEGLELEAAATIPVPFLTAYYALVTLAGLRKDEWVLIHGAAGGVGLAAVQIAQQRGATIVATAGSREKRELLRSLGVDHVLNSRSTAFADEMRQICPEGVGVVLNSLAGEAMERGLSTLKPFGRFIELGKRDYVANTRIGLRPFRRNLSYFGVDVDQLLSDRGRAAEIFQEIIGHFEAGTFRPLPYRVYSADETVDAFRLMQQSGHIGKIVLRPPTEPVAAPQEAEFGFASNRTHLLTGGFGGFGVETARWLADQGVRHLVMTGRNGPQSEEAHAVLAELEGRGVDVRAVACDVADDVALGNLLRTIRAEMPPLGGIMHAAMVLEDGLIENLRAEQFSRVLAPKVTGARLLDRMTAEDELDYFVLFSSITTFVGNPGQGAYVAANGFLEGLARTRREAGRPALAIAWGAISDVGVLARQKGLAEALAKRVGVKAMPAREALDLMVQALSRGPEAEPVIAIGSLDWSAARRLPALSSPTFAALVREGGAIETSERTTIDLTALVGSGEPDKVRKQVVDVIVEEIATVLRVPKQDVSLSKRLSEVGLDSLMAIELATALQDRFELSSPPSGSVGALTVPGLAETLIASVHAGAPDDESRVTQALADKHAGGDIDLSIVTPEVISAVNAETQTQKGLLH